jgi:hypothetical protein
MTSQDNRVCRAVQEPPAAEASVEPLDTQGLTALRARNRGVVHRAEDVTGAAVAAREKQQRWDHAQDRLGWPRYGMTGFDHLNANPTVSEGYVLGVSKPALP